MFCVCCLESCRPYIRLRSCKHSKFFEEVCKIHIRDMVLCLMCHRMLVKCYDFRKHIQESVLLIAKQAATTSTMGIKRKLHNLQYTSPLILEITLDSDLNDKTIGVKEINQSFGHSCDNPSRGDIKLACNMDPMRDTFNHPTLNIKTEIENDDKDIDPMMHKVKIKFEPLHTYPASCSKIKIENENSQSLYQDKVEIAIEDVVHCHQNIKTGENTSEDESDTNMDICDDSTTISNQRTTIGREETFEEQYQGKITKVTLTTDEVLAEIAEKELNEEYQNMSYKCEDCVLGFNTETSLQEHRNTWHTQGKPNGKWKLYECEICKRWFRSHLYRRHIMVDHHTRFDCGICETRYHVLSEAISHYNSTHSAHSGDIIHFNGHSCNMCDADFGTRVEYNAHMQQKHYGGGRPKCTECGKTYASKHSLHMHMQDIHTATDPEESFSCKQCGRKYKRLKSLNHHLSMKHGDGSSRTPAAAAYCKDCDVVFKSRQNYLSHLKTSTAHNRSDNPKFECAYCGRKYPIKYTLQQHIEWTHLNVARHYCTLCDKRFQNAAKLREHNDSIHNNIPKKKDKICEICGRGFTLSKILQQHIRIHTGERPLKCDLCDATFAQSAALYNHRKLKHKILPKNAKTSN